MEISQARELARSMGLTVIEPQRVPGHREVKRSTGVSPSQQVLMNLLLASDAISARCAIEANTPLALPGEHEHPIPGLQ